jgi:hypothetical protein
MVTLRSVSLWALLLLPVGPITASGAGNTVRIYQDFGYVEVRAEHVPVAIEEGRAARAAAHDVLRIPDVRFAIVEAGRARPKWGELSPEGMPLYPWVFEKPSPDAQSVPPPYVLRHEIGHDLFVRYLVPRTRTGQYGGDAPDWLDEMAAVAFEACAQVGSRRTEAGRYARTGTLIPLHRFLTMPHPELSAKRSSVSPRQIFSVALATSADTPQFYAMARALYDFLVDRTHSATVVADLATAFRNGGSLARWVSVNAGNARRDAGLKALNAEFLAWIATDQRYQANLVAKPGAGRSDGTTLCP